jgi:hypothetical protein
MSVQTDVDRGIEIYEQMEKLKIELKAIEARLQDAALVGEQVKLNDAEREGRQYLATGSDRIVPVILTADLIIGEFAKNSPRHLEIMDAAGNDGERVLKLFKPIAKFENRFDNGKKFRIAVEEAFDKATAPKFITACVARDRAGIPKSSIKVTWTETKAKVQS